MYNVDSARSIDPAGYSASRISSLNQIYSLQTPHPREERGKQVSHKEETAETVMVEENSLKKNQAVWQLSDSKSRMH